jgi:hypothetical protein
VLGPTLEAVCVENLEVALPVLEALPQGWLQLIDTREGGSVSATIHASIDATLLSKVDAPPVAEKLAALGCDPIKQMGQIAMDERVEVSVRVQVLKELCQYVAPKRKAVAVTGEDGGPLKGERTLSAWLDAINGQRLGPPSERVGAARDVDEE